MIESVTQKIAERLREDAKVVRGVLVAGNMDMAADTLVRLQARIGPIDPGGGDRLDELESANEFLRHRAEAAEAHVVRLQRAMAWQPIESAPKDRRVILVWRDSGIHFAKWNTNGEFWDIWAFKKKNLQCVPPTHWMPLPAPPEVIAALPPTRSQSNANL